MSRRSRAQRKLAEPDAIYKSRLVTLLISRILQSGKKSIAQKIVYNALEIMFFQIVPYIFSDRASIAHTTSYMFLFPYMNMIEFNGIQLDSVKQI